MSPPYSQVSSSTTGCSSEDEIESESELEEFVEEMQVFVSDEGTVERLELLSEISGGGGGQDKISLQSHLSSSKPEPPVKPSSVVHLESSKVTSSRRLAGGGGDCKEQQVLARLFLATRGKLER